MITDKELIKKLVDTAIKQIDVCNKYKKPIFNKFQKTEDMYANKVARQLKNRFNVPIPILGGFVDTLKSKIDDAPVINFKEGSEEDYKAALKIQAVWDREKSDDLGMWEFIDRQVKMLAIFQGRGIYKYYSDNIDGFQSHLEFKDMYDFIFEPQGGAKLDNHLFQGEENIFKTRSELLAGAKEGFYDRGAVIRLVNRFSDESRETKDAKTENTERYNRYRAMGLDPVYNNYVGEPIYNLNEHYLTHKGKKYYLFFDKDTKYCVKACELKEIISDEQAPYVSWATHEDPYNFVSKAPVDDIYPIADSMKVIFNQAMDNIQKRNWGQRAYDRSMFTNPKELSWRPDGLVGVDGMGKSISSAIHTFETPDNTTITVNMMEFLDNLMGTKSGITASAQGASDKDTKVGVYYGDLQQVADRLGTYNKAYKEAWAQLGKRFTTGLKDNLTEPYAIKIIGDKGVEWEELKKRDITKFDISVSGGADEIQLDEIKKQKQAAAVGAIAANPVLMQKLNTNWLTESILKGADFSDEEIKTALDNQNKGNAELMSEAAQSIQDILRGKIPKLNKGATTGFVQKIVDFAIDKLDNEKDDEKYRIMMDFAMAHLTIAYENMEKNAIINEGLPAPGQEGQAPGGFKVPAPTPSSTGNPQETAQRSQNISEGLSPNI